MTELSHLQLNKAVPVKSIPSKILKRFADLICKPLTDVINDNFEKFYFPNNLKRVILQPFIRRMNQPIKRTIGL